MTDAIEHRIHLARWWVSLFLAMPDHVHFLVSFSEESGLRETVTHWKRWISIKARVDWQRDFFDHRIRNDESESEKYDYILNNPVRAGLIHADEKWPWMWTPEI